MEQEPSGVPSLKPSQLSSVAPTSMPSSNPSVSLMPSVSISPSASPSSAPTCYAGLNNGQINNINPSDCRLHECSGNCVGTRSCRPGLICLKRRINDSPIVPGCGGNAYKNNNYCIKVRDQTRPKDNMFYDLSYTLLLMQITHVIE